MESVKKVKLKNKREIQNKPRKIDKKGVTEKGRERTNGIKHTKKQAHK